MAEFETPSFLQNRSIDDFYAKIRAELPAQFDTSEGSHGFNLTRPIAIVAAEICEFILPEVIRLILPESSYGDFLVGHAKGRGISPKEAVKATGIVEVTGTPTTVIPQGSLFSTAAVNGEPSVDYASIETVIIPDSGSVAVSVECTKAGIVGNTAANTIVFVSSSLKGITSVTNANEITGGTEAESDEDLIARINEYDQNLNNSFAGSTADYKRWAMSVDGVGDATVISAQDDSGLVTIILTDNNGAPANETLRENVYNKIMRPDNPSARLAPCNAFLSVVSPATMAISIMATIELETGATIEAIKAQFSTLLAVYLAEALEEGQIKYTRISSVLSSVEGVSDFRDLKFGIKTESGTEYGTNNIEISDSQLPTAELEDLLLTSGTV